MMNDDANSLDVDEFVLRAYESDPKRILSPSKRSSSFKSNVDNNSVVSPIRRYDNFASSSVSYKSRSMPSLESSSTSSDPPILPIINDKTSSTFSSLDGSVNSGSILSGSRNININTNTNTNMDSSNEAYLRSSSMPIVSTRSNRSSRALRSSRRRSRSRRGGRKRSRSKQKQRSGSTSSERTTRSTRSTRSGRSWKVISDDEDESDREVIPKTIKYAGEDIAGTSVAPSITTASSSRKQLRDIEEGNVRRKHFIPIEFAPAGPDDDFRVIVLLLDPRTRKFEFIHCYFDNEISLVKDVLNLISQNATYEPLRRQIYLGLCRPRTGEEMINSFMTKEYDMRNNEILIAIPRGLTGEKCVYHSKTILKKEKLVHLIRKTDPRWREQKEKALLELSQRHASSDPIVQFLQNTISIFVGKRRLRKRTIRYFLRFLFACFALNTITRYITSVHRRIMRPVHPGDHLTSGQWRNRCGLLSVFPESMTGCHSVSLVVSPYSPYSDGLTLTLLDEQTKMILWEMQGRQRYPKYSSNQNDNEILVNEKGQILISNSPSKLTTMTKHGVDFISPWPFRIVPPSTKKGWMQRLRRSFR